MQRIWRAHGLGPHRVRQFKLSRDPDFVPKPKDIVRLYVDPPAHAIVLSVDEKSQIQGLDRTQPGLLLKPGRCGTMTHDYKRHDHAVRCSQQTFRLVVERPESAHRRHPTSGGLSGRIPEPFEELRDLVRLDFAVSRLQLN